METIVKNLRDPKQELRYSCSARDAVVAAYAQFTCHDGNTWEYKRKYSHLVQVGNWFYFCGDFAARKEQL